MTKSHLLTIKIALWAINKQTTYTSTDLTESNSICKMIFWITFGPNQTVSFHSLDCRQRKVISYSFTSSPKLHKLWGSWSNYFTEIVSIIKVFERVISATEIIYYDGIPVLGLSSGSQYLYFPDKLLVTAFPFLAKIFIWIFWIQCWSFKKKILDVDKRMNSAINSVKGDIGNHY